MRLGSLTNGHSGGFLESSVQFENMISALDGNEFNSYSICVLSDSFDIGGRNPWSEITEFIQSAGSAARMCIEVRRLVDGEYQLFSAGRQVENGAPTPTEILWGDGHKIELWSNEVFAAPEAIEIYRYYWENECELPDDLVLRRLAIDSK